MATVRRQGLFNDISVGIKKKTTNTTQTNHNDEAVIKTLEEGELTACDDASETPTPAWIFFYAFPVVQRHSRRNSSKNSSSSRQCPFYAITRRPNKQSVTRWSPWRDNSGLLSVIRRSVILQCNALLSTVSGTIPVVLAPSGLVSFAVWNMSLCSTFLDGFIYVAFVFLHFCVC